VHVRSWHSLHRAAPPDRATVSRLNARPITHAGAPLTPCVAGMYCDGVFLPRSRCPRPRSATRERWTPLLANCGRLGNWPMTPMRCKIEQCARSRPRERFRETWRRSCEDLAGAFRSARRPRPTLLRPYQATVRAPSLLLCTRRYRWHSDGTARRLQMGARTACTALARPRSSSSNRP
jgi:hypothetical protein